MWGWQVAVAAACTGPDYETRVVGWSSDGATVLLRDEQKGGDEPAPDDPFLTLRLVDLASGRLQHSWRILTVAEKADAALRGARWKAAEAELVARKVVVDGALTPASAPWSLAGVDGPLAIVGGGCEDESRTWAISGPHTHVVLKEVGTCAAEASLFGWTAWVAPGGRGLYLTARSGCVGNGFERWVPRSAVGVLP